VKFSERVIAEMEFRAWASQNKVADRPQAVFAWLETDGKEHLQKLKEKEPSSIRNASGKVML